MDQSIRARYSEAILNEALRRFGIAPGDIAELGGFESFIYRFSRDGRPFILRLTHSLRRSPGAIHGEVEWMNYLAAGGASVAGAAASARGELVEAIDDGAGGHFLATAFHFAPGRPPWEVGWSAARRENYGRLIGRLHALTKTYEPSDPAYRRHAWPDDSVDVVRRQLQGVDDVAPARYRALVERLASLPRGVDDYGLIHFDAHEANFFIDGDTITLFDFDDCGYNWLANDLAMVIFYQAANRDNAAEHLAGFLPDFLRGYAAENRLDPAWAGLIHDFLTMREIELYAVIPGAFDVSPDDEGHVDVAAIPYEWPRRFMTGRRERIAAGQRFVEMDFGW